MENNLTDDQLNEKHKEIIDICTHNTMLLLASIKNKGFSEEAEFRLVDYGAKSNGEEINYRVGEKQMLIPYVEIEIPLKVIEEVIVGPKPNEKKGQSLKMFMKTYGLKIDVKKSSIPYLG